MRFRSVPTAVKPRNVRGQHLLNASIQVTRGKMKFLAKPHHGFQDVWPRTKTFEDLGHSDRAGFGDLLKRFWLLGERFTDSPVWRQGPGLREKMRCFGDLGVLCGFPALQISGFHYFSFGQISTSRSKGFNIYTFRDVILGFRNSGVYGFRDFGKFPFALRVRVIPRSSRLPL